MGGEEQIAALVRQAFTEKNIADRAVLDVDELLARVMQNVRRLVETLPEESLLRDKAWKELEPLIKVEMEPYSFGLRQAVTNEVVIGSVALEEYAVRQAQYAASRTIETLGGPLQDSVVDQVNRAKVGNKRFRQLFESNKGVAPWTQSMFRVVDRKVRVGIIEGQTTDQIAREVVHETISRGVPGVSLRGSTSARTIRSQAMTLSRTVTADVSRQVREEVYDNNPEAMEGMIWQFTSALDSKTCPTCAAWDGQRKAKKRDLPTTPVHPNCRCQRLPIDPEDPFWQDQSRNGQQIREDKAYADGYKTKTTGKSRVRRADGSTKAKEFYRTLKPVEGSFSDYLASSNKRTQVEFFGGGAFPTPKNPKGSIAYRRMMYFRKQVDEMNKDPQQILQAMLTGPSNARKFIPLP